MIYYSQKALFATITLLLISCSSTPQGYSRTEKPEAFLLLEKTILKKCRLEEGSGHFSGILQAAGVPNLPIDGIWSKNVRENDSFQAEISSPLGEPIVEISVPQTALAQGSELTQNQGGENVSGFLLVINTIGPQNLRALLCGHHLVANGNRILKANASSNDFLLQSGLKSVRGTISISTVTTLPLKIPGLVKGSSLLTTGLFGTDELGRVEWEGALRNNTIVPKNITYEGPTQKFKLFFSEFD